MRVAGEPAASECLVCMQIFPLLELSADYTEACIQLACGRLRRRASEETLSRISILVISRFQYFYWKGISLARSQSFPFPSLCCHAYRLPSQCTVMAWAIQPALLSLDLDMHAATRHLGFSLFILYVHLMVAVM